MGEKELKLILTLKDQMSSHLKTVDKNQKNFIKSFQSGLASIKKHWLAIAVAIAGVVIAMKKLGGVFKSVINAGAMVEKWTTKISVFTGSVETARKKLKELLDFSDVTPFTAQEVVNSSIMLLPIEDAKMGMTDMLKIAGNISAEFGDIRFEDAVANLSRSLTAGIASADLFYQKGVRSFIQKQVPEMDLLKLKSEELYKVFYKIFADPNSEYSTGIDKLSKTYDGLISTLESKWFLFKVRIANAGLFDAVKASLSQVLDMVNELSKSGKLDEWAQSIGSAMAIVAVSMINFLGGVTKFFMQSGIEISKLQINIKTFILWIKKAGLALSEFFALYTKGIPVLGEYFKKNTQMARDQISEMEDVLALDKERHDVLEDNLLVLQDMVTKGVDVINQSYSDTVKIQKASNGELEETVKKVDLVKSGVKETSEFAKSFSKSMSDWQEKMKFTGEKLAESFQSVTESLSDGIVDAFDKALFEGENFAQSMKSMLRDVGRDFLKDIMKKGLNSFMSGGGLTGMLAGFMGKGGGEGEGKETAGGSLVKQLKQAGGALGLFSSKTNEAGQTVSQGGNIFSGLWSHIQGFGSTLMSFGGSLMSGLGSILGGLGSSLSGILGGLGSMGGSMISGIGGIFGSIFSAFVHSGGYVGLSGITRYHSGGMAGLAPDEIPAILQSGEGVVSRRGMSVLGRDGLRHLNEGEASRSSGSGEPTIMINQIIQAWDASDVYRNRKSLANAIASELSQNGNFRKAVKEYA